MVGGLRLLPPLCWHLPPSEILEPVMPPPVKRVPAKSAGALSKEALAKIIPPAAPRPASNRIIGKREAGSARDILRRGETLKVGFLESRWRRGDILEEDLLIGEGMTEQGRTLGHCCIKVKAVVSVDEDTGVSVRGVLEGFALSSSRDLFEKGKEKLFHLCACKKRDCRVQIDDSIHLDQLRLITPELTPFWVPPSGVPKKPIESGAAAASSGRRKETASIETLASRMGMGPELDGESIESEEEAELVPVRKQRKEQRREVPTPKPLPVSARGDLTTLIARRVANHTEQPSPRKRRRRSRSDSRESRRRQDRSRRRRRDTSDSDSSSSRLSGETKLKRTARRHPGRLFKKVVMNVRDYLEETRKTTGLSDSLPSDDIGPVFLRYYHLVLANKMTSLRNVREARAICEIIDRLLQGQLGEALDLAGQRLVAVEAADAERSWSVAQHLELIPMTSSTALSEDQLRLAARSEASAMKLRTQLEKHR